MKKYEKQNRCSFIGALLSVFTGTVFAVWLQFFKGDVLDFAVAGRSGEAVRSACLLCLFILGEVVCSFFYDRLSAKYAIGCISDLRRDIVDSILSRSYVDYRKFSHGQYIAKYMTEAESIRDRRFRMRPVFWEILFKIILVSAALFWLDWRVAVITIFLLTAPLYVPKLIENRLQQAQVAYLKAMEDNLAVVSDWLSGFEMVKNYSIEGKIRERFRAINDDAMTKLMNDTRLGAVSQLISTLMSYLSYFVVLACAAWLVVRGEFSAGDFFVAIVMIDQLSWPLVSLAGIIRQFIAIRPVCDEMEAFLRRPEAATTVREGKLESEIRFRDVSFSYDGQRQILDGFDLTVEKGKRYLLKGPSGCGKTTAVNLLLGYYDVTAGSITVDGEALMDPYGLITVVRQEAVLFRDTLRNNLTMYREIPDGKLRDALRNVGLERFADSLDLVVEEGGGNFSGGEKKRICLARALLRDTDVLILDEPLANLDQKTAEQIEDLLLGISDKTVLMVSHQFTASKLSAFDAVVDFTA